MREVVLNGGRLLATCALPLSLAIWSDPQGELARGPLDLSTTVWHAGHQSGVVSDEKYATLFGISVASVGDVDGDGTEEIAIGAPLAYSKLGRPGAVLIVSVPSGRLVRTIYGIPNGQGFGFTVKASVMDGNPGEPVLIVCGRSESLGLFDPKTGKQRLDRSGVARFHGVQHDSDSDGIRDLVVTLRREMETRIAVLSGRTGEVIDGPGLSTGHVFLEADMDGDGYGDFAAVPRAGERQLQLVSGRTFADGTRLELPRPIYESEQVFAFAAMNSNGDKRDDLAVMSPNTHLEATCIALFQGTALATPRRIPAHDLVDKQDELRGTLIPRELFNVGDITGDGVDELVASTAWFLNEQVTCYSGGDGKPIWTTKGVVEGEKASIIGVQDLDADGHRDIASGRVWYLENGPEFGRGELILVSGATGREIRRIAERDYVAISFNANSERSK